MKFFVQLLDGSNVRAFNRSTALEAALAWAKQDYFDDQEPWKRTTVVVTAKGIAPQKFTLRAHVEFRAEGK